VGPFSGSAPLGSSLPIAAGVFAGGYQMGTVVWKVTDAQTDGADVLSGLFDCGICAFADADLNVLPNIEFNAATVNVPEPGTALLLGLAFAGLALGLRRRR
jgi:hypothetical protein